MAVSNSPARKRARYHAHSTYFGTALAARSFSSHPESSIPIVCHYEDSLKAENRDQTQKEGTGQSRCTPFDVQHHLWSLTDLTDLGQVTRIDVLPDEVLLAIFGHYVDELQNSKKEIEAWQSLIHVCRSWRRVVFESPHRLDLQLVCTPATSAKDTLDAWPALPILIQGKISSTSSVDNIVEVLGHSSRIRSIELYGFSGWQLKKSC
jgi:hypothetical protein